MAGAEPNFLRIIPHNTPMLSSSHPQLASLMMEGCPLMWSFMARQGIIIGGGICFISYVYVRIKIGKDKRTFKIFAADVSKQVFQQMIGGAMMAAFGVTMSTHGYDSLSWYGAEFPFEIIFATSFTHIFKKSTENWAKRQSKPFFLAMQQCGKYGTTAKDFQWNVYFAQLTQAVIFVGLPARIISILIMSIIVNIPNNPLSWIASMYFRWDAMCFIKDIVILYVNPFIGNTIQFIVVDWIQKLKLNNINEDYVKFDNDNCRQIFENDDDMKQVLCWADGAPENTKNDTHPNKNIYLN